MTKNINQTSQLFRAKMFQHPENHSPTKNHSRRWKYTQPDLTVFCFLCAEQFAIKYILPKKQYSLKNNWGYWTSKETFKNQYICDNCLIKIHHGGIINWVSEKEKADIFYTYLSRKTLHC
ncbi:hypothetical protein [endosymbiont GvMRE of Glomus versiforme]|uniref:hypothetical protein n=1 Tax=endosymbiont GvMRE of Glomus versiforme TaxID=2039283 RepID=UPI0011C43D98|nr:hypothetical protein [endosymbiont GvMRE of Glomus versiforme]